MTNEEYQQQLNELITNVGEHRPQLLRAWIEVFHSNMLYDLGYDQTTYINLYLKQGWGYEHILNEEEK